MDRDSVALRDLNALGILFARCAGDTFAPTSASARFSGLLGDSAESVLTKLAESDKSFSREALFGLEAGASITLELTALEERRPVQLRLIVLRDESGDFLVSGADISELRIVEMSLKSYSRVIEDQERKMQRIASTDHLTQVGNRRALFENFKRHYRDPANQAGAICLLDIDHFKSYNDRYGHDFGDHVLRFFAGRVNVMLDEDCFFARIGGEEFCIHSYTRDAAELGKLVNGVLLIIANESLKTPQQTKTRISFSAGVAEYNANGTSLDELLMNADKALYLAKVEGRSRIIEFDTELFEKRDDTLIPKFRSPDR